jgi:hypothetical protein
MRPLLANSRRSPRVPARTERFFIDEFDDSVVRGVLGEVNQIVLGHEGSKPKYGQNK